MKSGGLHPPGMVRTVGIRWISWENIIRRKRTAAWVESRLMLVL